MTITTLYEVERYLYDSSIPSDEFLQAVQLIEAYGTREYHRGVKDALVRQEDVPK